MSPWDMENSLSDTDIQGFMSHPHTQYVHITGDLSSKHITPLSQKLGGYVSSTSHITMNSNMEMFNQLQPAYHDTMRETHKYKLLLLI